MDLGGQGNVVYRYVASLRFLINGRLSLGWRGRRAALGAVIGFCIVVATFVVGYIFPGQHKFE